MAQSPELATSLKCFQVTNILSDTYSFRDLISDPGRAAVIKQGDFRYRSNGEALLVLMPGKARVTFVNQLSVFLNLESQATLLGIGAIETWSGNMTNSTSKYGPISGPDIANGTFISKDRSTAIGIITGGKSAQLANVDLSDSPKLFICKSLNGRSFEDVNLSPNLIESLKDAANQLLSFSNQPQEQFSQSKSRFPLLQDSLKSIGLYGSDGNFIAGQDLRKVGATLAAAVIATEALRLIAAAIVKNPAIANAIVPVPALRGLTIDQNAVGLSSVQIKEFLSMPESAQGYRCTNDVNYQKLCKTLSDLEFEIAYARGDAT